MSIWNPILFALVVAVSRISLADVQPAMHIPFDGSPQPINSAIKTESVGNCQFVKTSRGKVMKLDGKGSYVDTGMLNLALADEWTV